MLIVLFGFKCVGPVELVLVSVSVQSRCGVVPNY
jgi:hypothetical protein